MQLALDLADSFGLDLPIGKLALQEFAKGLGVPRT